MSNEKRIDTAALEAADFEMASGTTEGVTEIAPLPAPLRGGITVPGDKSISHRAVLFSAMAEGTSRVMGVLDSEDVRSSIRCVRALGAEVSLEKQPDGSLAGGITGWGAKGPKQPDEPLDCGNSGTTARLLMGILAPRRSGGRRSAASALAAHPVQHVVDGINALLRGVHRIEQTLPLMQQHALCFAYAPRLARGFCAFRGGAVAGAVGQAALNIFAQIAHSGGSSLVG